MLVIVYQRALAAVRVARVAVARRRGRAGDDVRRAGPTPRGARRCPRSRPGITDETPSLVMRAKAHGAMLRIIDDRQAALAAWCRALLETELAGKADAAAVLAFWDGTSGPADARVTALAQWVRDGNLDPATRNALENTGRTMRARTRDVIGEWASLLTDREALGAGLRPPRARAVFVRASSTTSTAGASRAIACARRDAATATTKSSRSTPRTTPCCCASTSASAAACPRGRQGRARLRAPDGRRGAGLLAAGARGAAGRDVSAQRSVTLAGDTAQAIAPEHGFSTWTELLDFLDIAHERVEPLRVSYRSTREIVDCAEHVLGPLMGDVRPVAPRAGAPVESFPFAAAGECAEFLSHALKELVRNEPDASVALLARHPEQARARLRGARARGGADAAAGRRSGLLVLGRHRRHRRAPVEGAGVRHRHPARRDRRVVSRRPTTRAACCTSR